VKKRDGNGEKMTNDLKIINSSFKWQDKDIPVIYKDADTFDDLSYDKCQQCYGICFFGEKIVIGGNGDHWTFLGGHVEKDEIIEDALKREVQEESNMKVLKFAPVGYQKVGDENKYFYQLRYVCIVEPYGEFVKDPVGDVIEIKLIEPSEVKKYIDWGEVGDRIIERAMELKNSL
jgi:ADP-ribose pyrophosphatase YjhB (NUDIX family)